MNNRETSTRYENRFSMRIAKLIAAGALAASMVPTAAWADENAEELPSRGGECAQVLDAGSDPAADEADASDEPQPLEAERAAGEEPARMNDGPASAANAEASLTDEPAAQSAANTTVVAQIGDATYASLDEAVAAAADGDTIKVFADCETEGLNLSKDLTIEGGKGLDRPTITFTKHGIALWGKALTFKNCNVVMNGVGSTPYTAAWNWMTVCADQNASLSLDNATMTLDGANTDNKHAIYFCSNNKLNLTNGSNLTIKNYQQDALEWDGGDGGYNVNITDSTFVSDHNRSGFTGTFYVTIANSRVDVVNSTGNGSNGSHFIVRDSTLDFNANRSHGLSTGILSVKDSTINAHDNGRTGIIFNNAATFENAVVSISGTKGTSYWSAGMRAMTQNASATIDSDTTMTIADNAVTGIFLDGGTKLEAEEGAKILVTRNYAEQENCSTFQDLARRGGGLVVRSGASAQLPNSAEIYNNHASIAGDDLYAEDGGSIAFGNVGTGWRLDGNPDCKDLIDGWYDDSADTDEVGNRWEAHAGKEGNHLIRVEAGTLTVASDAPVALKAAHGIYGVSYQFVSGTPDMELPNEVLALVPVDEGQYASGVTVTALQPGQTSVKVEGGTWTFVGYDADEKSIDGDILFTGTWQYAADPVDPGTAEPDGAQDSADPAAPESQTGASDEKLDAKEIVKTGDDTLGLAASAAAVAAGAAAVAMGARRFGRRR